jgi:prepilin-type N-terminal cleavage/methylation domain-containing protein
MKSVCLEERGFTLVETIVAIAVFVLLMSAISVLFVSLYRSQKVDIGLIERSRIAGRAIDIMSSEIRKANRGENGNFHLAVTGAQNLVFYSDIDGDDETEKVAYNLEGNDITKTVVEPGTNYLYQGTEVKTVVCSGVQNGAEPVFLYYDESYTGNEPALTDPVDNVSVKVIGINLYVNVANSGVSTPFHIETKIQIRNL